MERMIIKANDEIKILINVCDYTGYAVTFEEGKIVTTDTYGSNRVFKYDTVKDALIGWLPTMEEQQDGADEDVDMWSKEIEYVKELKANREIQKFLYDNLTISFYGNDYDLGFGTSCEFEITSPLKPLFYVGQRGHYADKDEKCTDSYVELTSGRIEMDEETGKTVVWIFEPTIDCGGEFLHQVKTLHYDNMELQREIIKRWNEEVNQKVEKE